MYNLAFQVSKKSIASNNSLFSQLRENNFAYILDEDTSVTKRIAVHV